MISTRSFYRFVASLVLLLSISTSTSVVAVAAEKLPSTEVAASPLATLPRDPRAAGFTMTVSMATVAANGYHPIYFTFKSPIGRFTADRTFDLTLKPIAQSNSELELAFRTRCDVAQSSASQTFVCYVPYYVPWDHLEVQVDEPGKKIEGNRRICNVGKMPLRIADQTTSVGIIHPLQSPATSPFPDVRTLVTLLGGGPLDEGVNVARLPDTAARQRGVAVQPAFVQFRSISPNAMLPSWLGYSQLDVIMIHGPTLKSIADAPAAEPFDALCDFVAAGGNLWIYDAKELPLRFTDLKWTTIENQVVGEAESVARLNLALENDTSDLVYESWNEVRKESQDRQWNQNAKKLDLRQVVFDKMVTANHPSVNFLPTAELAKSIRSTPFGSGRLVAIDESDPFPGSFQFWQSVADLSGTKQLSWTLRNGIDVRYGDDYYWSLLIDSVGGPPVKIFFFINTLFILVVGPVAYLFFRRKQRLYLLLFVAPAIAFLVTSGLFLSAIVADGFETRIRARQITWQDADAGYQVQHDRMTYFSSIGRGDGILLPKDTAVFPVLGQPAETQYFGSSRNPSPRRIVSDLTGETRYSGQFLPSRAQVQYLTLRPDRSPALVSLAISGDVITAENHSDSVLHQVVVCDQQSRLWTAENVMPGGTSKLEPLVKTSIRDQLQVAPLRLASFVPRLSNSYYRRGSSGAAVSAIEEQLNAWLNKMRSGTFIATTELRDESLGIDEPTTEKSVHVIMGELP